MYKTLTASDFRKSLRFESDYKVDAFVCCGREWPEEEIEDISGTDFVFIDESGGLVSL